MKSDIHQINPLDLVIMAATSKSIDASAVEKHTAPAPKKVNPKSQEELIIRRARIWDAGEIGRIAATTYLHSGLSHFVAPYRLKYRSHWERGFIQRAYKRLLDPRNMSFVVCTKSNPKLPVGYASFVRLGDDEGARKHIESHSRLERLVMWILSLLYGIWCRIVSLIVGGDKSEDKKAAEAFARFSAAELKTHWSQPERLNRWHAQSVVIRDEFQGRKAGKRLMAEVIAHAEAENVVVGLESSAKGEMMYRSVGFELLGRFQSKLEEDAGGVMMYTPKARR